VIVNANGVGDMEKDTQATFLESNVDGLIKSFEKDRKRHKKAAFRVKIYMTGLAATATVLLGLKDVGFDTAFQNITLAINALLTVISAYEAFYEPRKLWIRETFVLSKLKDIQRDLLFEMASCNISPQSIEEYKGKVNNLLDSALEEWINDKSPGIAKDRDKG